VKPAEARERTLDTARSFMDDIAETFLGEGASGRAASSRQ
jgi:hypothetical protein